MIRKHKVTGKQFKAEGSGTKICGKGVKMRVIYESICNHVGCYADATSNYGFCVRHDKGRKLDKDGSWIHK